MGSPESDSYQRELSADPESRSAGGSTGNTKRRQSRAGTRSVTTLSAAQLERKRANDREAQRAIRQRTKEHIDQLEKRIVDLSSGGEDGELNRALQEIKRLKDENAYLRAKLNRPNLALGVPDSPTHNASGWDDISTASPLSNGDMQVMSQAPTTNSMGTTAPASTMTRTDLPPFQSPQWQTGDPLGTAPQHYRKDSLPAMRQHPPILTQDLPSEPWKDQRGGPVHSPAVTSGFAATSSGTEYQYMMNNGPQFSNRQQQMGLQLPQAQDPRDGQMRHPPLGQQGLSQYQLSSQQNYMSPHQHQPHSGGQTDPSIYQQRTQSGDGPVVYGR